MANLRETKNRISSIKNTSKITHTMQMISAIKSHTSQQAVYKITKYADKINDMIAGMDFSYDFDSYLLNNRKKISSALFIVIGPSRGFVGALPANITNTLANFVSILKHDNKNITFSGIGINKLGLKTLNSANIDSENFTGDSLASLPSLILEKFKDNLCDRVYIIYPKYINLLNYKAEVKQLLPIDPSILDSDHKKHSLDDTYIFTPNKDEILESLLLQHFEAQIMYASLNLNASEHSTRMVTMKNATDKANELSTNLTAVYNRQRQSKITEQVIEISQGNNKL